MWYKRIPEIVEVRFLRKSAAENQRQLAEFMPFVRLERLPENPCMFLQRDTVPRLKDMIAARTGTARCQIRPHPRHFLDGKSDLVK